MSKERLVELLTKTMDEQYEKRQLITPQHTADYLLANGVEALPLGTLDALFGAVDALADMVNQFGYSTTFKKQEAVCDGGLSALEEAFAVLADCGYKINSNGTINRKNLWTRNMREALEAKLIEEKEQYAPFIGSKQDREGH